MIGMIHEINNDMWNNYYTKDEDAEVLEDIIERYELEDDIGVNLLENMISRYDE